MTKVPAFVKDPGETGLRCVTSQVSVLLTPLAPFTENRTLAQVLLQQTCPSSEAVKTLLNAVSAAPRPGRNT